MQKIILQIGLLIFFLSLIYYARLGLPLESILLRSFAFFVGIVSALSLISILFIKLANKIELDDD